MSLGYVLLGSVCVVVGLLVAVLVGVAAGGLARLARVGWPQAIVQGALAFAGSLTLFAVVATAIAAGLGLVLRR
ncbi:hypothetical protein ACF1AO_22960 [Streptomyces longwoodensis]|uniref:hypothetical protein n=1 Tax=Streptomyces longwoodensis TaxID=68231 RepID=UPI003701ABC4